MAKVNFKTPVVNKIRRLGLLPIFERILVRQTQQKNPRNFFVRMIPDHQWYDKCTWRVCERDGVKYRLDISDWMQYCLYYGIITEPREKLYNLVRNGTTIIDVGTNIGETLLNFALLNRDGINIGFEPVPFIYERAKEHIDLNETQNITLLNLGLSNDDKALVFNFPNKHNSGGIFLSSDSENDNTSRKVEATKLDNYAKKNQIKNVSLIKIDVEGFEMKVLEGSVNVICEHKPTLFLEVNDGFLRRQGSSAKAMFTFIESHDYDIFYAEDDRRVDINNDFAGKHFDVICLPH